ncbi:helix-turn-helix domain-containing protein [Streptomyces roseolus]|uniref:helix-turn-helix domain-containing protein n=1 Tax=Streptomyces roseolus TaxID=67358 RepID=UPI003666A99A
MERELDGAPAVLVLGDASPSVIHVQHVDRSVRQEMTDLGITVGAQVGEEHLGINALGTPALTGKGVLLRGEEHSAARFSSFVCYGHPIVHPASGRLEGVLSISCRAQAELPLLGPMARQIVRDIEERLRRDAGLAQQRLFAAFQKAARRRGHAVMVVGEGIVLASPPALDLLPPVDQTIVRAWSEIVRPLGEATRRYTLASGRTVRLRSTSPEGTNGSLIHILPERDAPRELPDGPTRTARPLLIVGEPGTGRTTRARQAAGAGATILDADDALAQGPQAWARSLEGLFATEGPPIVVENLSCLSEHLVTLLAHLLRDTPRDVVLTASPGVHLETDLVPLVAVCAAREDLVPLRQRRHDIAPLARSMLAEIAGAGRVRLSRETVRVLTEQPWHGNLSELREVVQTLAASRSAGDLVPSDLPLPYRQENHHASPLRKAERDIILAAIAAAGGNKLQAARALGVSRSTLYNRMRALRIH